MRFPVHRITSSDLARRTITPGSARTSTICQYFATKVLATFKISSPLPSRTSNARTDHLRHGRWGLDLHPGIGHRPGSRRPSLNPGQLRQTALSAPDRLDANLAGTGLSSHRVSPGVDGSC